MPSKTYTEEFKRDAVALYENFSGASLTTIATDLGINHATLHNWVKRYRAAAHTMINTPDSSSAASAASVTDTERIRQLERQVKRL